MIGFLSISKIENRAATFQVPGAIGHGSRASAGMNGPRNDQNRWLRAANNGRKTPLPI